MQQRPQLLPARQIERGVDALGPGRAPAQRRHAPGVERDDDPPDGLVVTANLAGDLGGALAPGAGEQDLAPPQDESVGRAQAGGELLALGVRDGTHVDWYSHDT